jgi:hypothetical protein
MKTKDMHIVFNKNRFVVKYLYYKQAFLAFFEPFYKGSLFTTKKEILAYVRGF